MIIIKSKNISRNSSNGCSLSKTSSINWTLSIKGASASKAIVVEGNSTDVVFDNLEEVLAEPDVQIRIFGKQEVKGHRRFGVILALDETVEKALAKAERAYAKLKVIVN